MSESETVIDNKNSDRLSRMFPDYFVRYGMPPKEAKEEILEVYRACKTNALEKGSFLSTFEENEYKFFDEESKHDPSTFSMSVYEKPRDVKRFAITNVDIRPPYKIAKGKTLPIYGKILRTKEYKPEYKKSSHVDWWLYDGAEPYRDFELIEDFKAYLEARRKG